MEYSEPKMGDFEEPTYVRTAVDKLESDEQIAFNYLLNHMQVLRKSRHDFANRVPALEVKMEKLESKIDKLIKQLEPIAEAKSEADGAMKFAKFLGFGTIISTFIGIIAYVLHKLGGST